MRAWGFRLPMASAILMVFWPDQFTVYDAWVCDELRDFQWLTNRSPERVWEGYCAYREAVRRAAPSPLSLREKDRFLLGSFGSTAISNWNATSNPGLMLGCRIHGPPERAGGRRRPKRWRWQRWTWRGGHKG